MNPPTAAPSTEILLNLAYLSSTLKNAGHEVLIIDGTAPFKKMTEEEINKKILDFKPHFIGVTLTITFIPFVYDYLKRLSKLKIPIVAGGPHANCLPEEVLSHNIDIVAVGEGEETILELAEYFLKKKELKEIDGIVFKNEKGVTHFTKPRKLITDLDRISFPDFESFPIEHYSGSPDPNSNPVFWSVFSSRGCPYNCIFCSSHNVFGRTYRARSPENVFKEIEQLAEKFGAEAFAFQDDEAFINKKRIIEFCNLVKKSKYPLRFSARLRIDSLDEEMLRTMKESGFKRLAFGIESFNDETLEKINKKYNVKKVHEGLDLLRKVDFSPIHFNDMIGFPWETPEHLQMNLKEIKKIGKKIKIFSASNTPVPYPGTELYAKYHKEYGFTDWWLDPEKNTSVPDIITFFTIFMSTKRPLYWEDTFWNYSPEFKKAMGDFSFELAKINFRQYYSFPTNHIIYHLCRISYLIWKKSPKLEKILFKLISKIVMNLGIDKKTKFVYQS